MGAYQIGLLGLGVMGSSLAKNLINHGFVTALTSKNEAERARFNHTGDYKIFDSNEAFVAALKKPRVIFLMVTAGKPVDMVIEALSPLMEAGDAIIDGGNSFYQDTSRRYNALAEKGIHYLGVGVSGGEKGALEGPSMMVGGSRAAWETARPFLTEVAAKIADDTPCCDYLGAQGAGHYVKMVHNGIEYGILQLIAETYQLLTKGMGYSVAQAAEVFARWREGALSSYLIDITALVLSKADADSGEPLITKICDMAGQKGTGNWTLLEGIARGVYIPTIAEAVFARALSQKKALRQASVATLSGPQNKTELTELMLQQALHAGIVCCYTQGLELIAAASDEFGWNIDLEKTVSLWRGGCIIRSVLLFDIMESYRTQQGLQNLMLAPRFAALLNDLSDGWRKTVTQAAQSGIAAPALISTLSYYDSCRTDPMPTALVQGLRDCFGAHTYHRVDKEGSFHTDWEN
ncbi:NADP-dependent phosphogluconate dehydrogenase [Oscillospiraceae bacterium LTW-04]|nr:NADP-dependent phosphogluconate dehydrogenase [Oscillospiraceae bacterium MB24-C1]